MSADTSLDQERRIAEKASAVLNSLGPTSPRNAEKLSVLSELDNSSRLGTRLVSGAEELMRQRMRQEVVA